jgi:hypothetical protein
LIGSRFRVIGSVVIKELDKANKIRKISDFRKLFGIWKDREITSSALRQKAWRVKEFRNGNNY